MPPVDPRRFSDAFAHKGLALAERRLLHMSELYRSGRWAHYYATQRQFAAHMLDAIRVAKIWAKLASVRHLEPRPDRLRRAA
jgi:hypothetical protein